MAEYDETPLTVGVVPNTLKHNTDDSEIHRIYSQKQYTENALKQLKVQPPMRKLK